MHTIEITSLTKYYGDTVAVEDLSLSLSGGEIFGFLGPNGAGKTTTMRMLTTLLSPTDGDATINGASIRDRDAVRDKFGYLPESPALYPELSAREQLSLAADLRDIPPDEATERIDELLDRFRWSDAADEPIAEYSTGMRQMVGLIQAVIHRPAVLFLDEPTSGLDPRAARTLREIITEFADSGTTVFLSTHILPVVEEISDTVGVLRDGHLVAEGPPSELEGRLEASDSATLEDVFLELTTDDPHAEAADG